MLIAAPTATAAPELAGSNSVSVRDGAAMRVTLPRDLSFNNENLPTAKFDVDALWAAISLYRLEPQMARGVVYHPMLTIFHTYVEGSPYASLTSEPLPAGDYLLVLTSKPRHAVNATLTLPGLAGAATFMPGTPVPIRHRVRASRPSQTEDNTIVVSAMNPMRGAGFGILTESDTTSIGWMGRSEHCYYAGNREDQPSDAEPGCPGGSSTARIGRPFPVAEVQIENGERRAGTVWSFNRPPGFGEGWNFHTFSGDPPTASIETTSLDFADLPAELAAAGPCAADAASAPPDVCRAFAPLRRARRTSDRPPSRLPSGSGKKYGLDRQLARRLARTKLGRLFLAPGRAGSCAVLVHAKGTLANCRENRFLLRGQVVFTFTGRTGRTLIAALLPDGARRLRLKLTNHAPGSVRLRGNAAIAYTSFRRYRGGTLRWADRDGRARVTKLPYFGSRRATARRTTSG